MTPQQIATCLDRLWSDISQLNAAITTGVLGEVAAVSLPDTTLRLLAISDKARAAATVAVGRVHAGGVLALDGFVSTKSWLRAEARLSDLEAGRLLARSRDLEADYQATAAAWLAGDINSEHVREITLGLKSAVSHLEASLRAQLRVRGEGLLGQIAASGPPEQVKAAAERLRNAADPDGASESDMDNYDAQALSLTGCAGGWVPQGFLDTESGVLLQTALDRIIDRWYREGGMPCTGAPVIDPVTGEVDVAATEAAAASAAGRTNPAQRKHLQALALNHLVQTFVGSDAAGTTRGARPHLVVHVDLADLVAGTGSGELSVPGSEPVPIPMAAVARIACDADITAILERLRDGCREGLVPFDGDLLSAAAKDLQERSRELLWAGLTRRSVSPRQWNALVARDSHCQFPGCRVDVTRCHPHHVREWEDYGPTDLDNLILLCARHHRFVHNRHWRITATPGMSSYENGCWTIRPPDRRTRP